MPTQLPFANGLQRVKMAVSRSHALKLSLSLVMLVMCVLFLADVLSLRGNQSEERQNSHKVVAESLAVQLSTLASLAEEAALQHAVSEFVLRNSDVLAAALFPASGAVIASSGDLRLLTDSSSFLSTTENMSVPLYEGQRTWGEVRLAFRPLNRLKTDAAYFAFMSIGCLVAFAIFLRRVLMQLDPSRAVPGRVNTAFNLFTEGVVIMDDQMRILLTNNSASDMIGQTPESQIGGSLDKWPWVRDDNWYSPWRDTLKAGAGGTDHHLYLEAPGGRRLVVVNCTLVGDANAERSGVMVTLNDMSALQKKNYELSATLQQLEESKRAIAEKNIELQTLASTDPLSNLMNRRSFMERFEALHNAATDDQHELVCIMLDIDHFKTINDTHGHSVGDEVICAVANCLRTSARESDLVARYGGEEFVMVLPETTRVQALALAERLRLAIYRLAEDDSLPVNQLSASIGVSDLQPDMEERDVYLLLELADKALYAAKESGRNRVVFYDPDTLALLSASRSLDHDSVGDLQQMSKATESAYPGQIQAAEPLSPASSNIVEPAEFVKSIMHKHQLELEMLKSHDLLTHLPKRQLFMQAVENEISRAQRTQSVMGVVSIEIRDVIRFTASLGHSRCEKMIKQIVDHVKDGLRVSDRVASVDDENNLSHLTDNQFGVLLSELADVDQILPVLTRIRRLLLDPVVLDGQNIYPGFNMGIAIYPDCGGTAAELLESASEARLEASRLPDKVAYHFASSDVADRSRAYLALESDLYEAVSQRALEVYFQPKFDLAKRCITGAEALVRWFHPERGHVPPDRFIPVAETNGLIREIFQQVLEMSLAQLGAWDEAGLPRINVAVNLSGSQLRDKRLVDSIMSALSDAGLEPYRLELELTETTIIQFPEQARVILNTLHNAGIKVSMDDFGTGYTSLGLLAELPLSCVKIDRSFINAMQSSQRSHAIVESVISMAHALSLRVVAEGVETSEQLETLDALGCDDIQGYLISRPLDADAFARLQGHELTQVLAPDASRKAG